MGFSKMFVCFPVKKSEKKQKSLKGTSVAFNVKKKNTNSRKFLPRITSIGEHVNIQFGSFESRHFFGMLTRPSSHIKKNAKKKHVCCFSYPKLPILRRIFCHRRKHKRYLSTLVFVTPKKKKKKKKNQGKKKKKKKKK